MAMRPRRGRAERAALDKEGLEQIALGYAGRYATTRARLAASGAADVPRAQHPEEK